MSWWEELEITNLEIWLNVIMNKVGGKDGKPFSLRL